MNTAAIRCANDLKMYQALLDNTDVKRMRERIQRMEEKRESPGIRRHLLATSVRLSRSMSAGLHNMADHCTERLGLCTPLELYAYAGPQFNAACFKPEEGRLFIMFSSSLLEAFADKELLFVMGHELGHHVYQHHDIPIGYISCAGSVCHRRALLLTCLRGRAMRKYRPTEPVRIAQRTCKV